jgi:hypothetical protein
MRKGEREERFFTDWGRGSVMCFFYLFRLFSNAVEVERGILDWSEWVGGAGVPGMAFAGGTGGALALGSVRFQSNSWGKI